MERACGHRVGIFDVDGVFHHSEDHLQVYLTYLAAMFNMLLDVFHDLHPKAAPYKLSIAEFSL
jgi:hypothetical protein